VCLRIKRVYDISLMLDVKQLSRLSYAACRSEFPMGIRRLRFPAAGPSRSTLKLEEAFLHIHSKANVEEI